MRVLKPPQAFVLRCPGFVNASAFFSELSGNKIEMRLFFMPESDARRNYLVLITHRSVAGY